MTERSGLSKSPRTIAVLPVCPRRCSIIAFLMFMVLNVLSITMYEGIKNRIVPPSEQWAWLYKSPALHYFFMFFAAMAMAPVMNTSGGIAEWIAAFKTAKSHKFEYEVALKPQASKNRT